MKSTGATLERILIDVCAVLNVPVCELAGNGRHPQAVLARELVVYLARRSTVVSYPRLARAMGRRGHSTFLNQEQRFTARLGRGETVEALERVWKLSELAAWLLEAVKSEPQRKATEAAA